MALDQAQWYAKIKRWVPSWYFEKNQYAAAVFQGLAAVFAQIQQDIDDAQAATFILDSPGPVIDLLGDERDTPRLTGESDASYQPRVQNSLFQKVSLAQLQSLVNAVLNNGPAFFIDNEEYGYFDDPDVSSNPGFLYYDDYYSRWISLSKWYNWFTVIIPAQTGGNDTLIQQAVVAALEANIAFGVTYDILDETPTAGGDPIVMDDGSGILTTDGGDPLVTD
jgi:hypothetical protein